MLLRRPDLARHVRRLAVRPDGRGEYTSQRARAVSELLYELAPSLDALQSFCWDSEEVPPCDDIWFALKQGCVWFAGIYRRSSCGWQVSAAHEDRNYGWMAFSMPEELGVYSAGETELADDAQLFEFTKLTSFSMTLKPGYFSRHIDDFWLGASSSSACET